MTPEEYASLDGLGLAQAIRDGETTAAEAVEAAISIIERRNPSLNAVVYAAFEEARDRARGSLADGPFSGTPFLIKDLAMPVAGWPRTSGSRFARGIVDRQDGGLTSRYRRSGVIPIGKTNTPEFGITGTTEGALLGPCRNPWNPERIAGGSSGGSAAAVASGMVPIAHASDGLGSIRIPAACCGLVGLKVTRDRVPNLPDGYDYAAGFVVDHVVSRTVRDSAAMLDATDAPEADSPYPAPPKAGPFLAEVGRSPGRLRISWSSETPSGRPIEPEIREALERTAELLRRLGHEVTEEGLGIDYRALYAARAPLSGANFAAGVARLIQEIGREPELDELEPLTWASLRGGRQVTGAMALRSLQDLRMLNRATLSFFRDRDIYLTPVLGTPVPRIGHIDPVGLEPREIGRRQGQAFPFTPLFNFSGQPSLSLPLETSSDGLPVGMMFTARYADEATLFRLAGQLEREAPWAARRPPLWA